MTARRNVALAVTLLSTTLWIGCAASTEPPGIATPDRQVFDAQVWPILVRDCGFSACHGDPARFFRVLGPGHERLDPAMRLAAPVTEAELQYSYDRARSMLDPEDPSLSPLLRKPLEVAAGGSGHEGIDTFGRDVFQNRQDPRYQALANWALGMALARNNP